MSDSNKLGGKKDDTGKPAFGLIPQMALEELARVMTHGAKTYGAYNYLEGMAYSRLTDAAGRHVNKYLRGQNIDKDSGCYHLALAAAELLMTLELHLRGIALDDRYKHAPEPRAAITDWPADKANKDGGL
jgi:hypothetical protein